MGTRIPPSGANSAILSAAIQVLDRDGEAGLEAIAAAGVSRQTVYAHFPNRAALLDAVLAELTAELLTELDEPGLELRPAAEGLRRVLAASWLSFQRHPLLLSPGAISAGSAELHEPVLDRIRAILERGKVDGSFDPDTNSDWLLMALMTLGHAAGEAVASGAMTRTEAWDSYKWSIDRLTVRA
ncbi:TetR/AcrR family transcriptional regulator [Kribbella deserti]|uniref:TetR/AcrR family transcriptional regulator n=1 Tax=Kribbella deserti TaxID=1926257 RepID=A0ABV6QKX0_9ACTN